jgi:hypothetical protein
VEHDPPAGNEKELEANKKFEKKNIEKKIE